MANTRMNGITPRSPSAPNPRVAHRDIAVMVTAGMRRYKVRTTEQAALIGPEGHALLDPQQLFGGIRPLRFEIGFGHGEFITAMAQAHPDESFIGIEHDPLRVTKTAHRGHKAGLDNLCLFNADAHSFVRQRLPSACLSRVYLLFSDPWPKPDHRRRRLASRAFLVDLARVCAPGCQFIFASDTHNYAMQVLNNISTIPGLWSNLYLPAGYRINIPTRFPTLFETYKKDEGCTIAYLLLERTAAAAPAALPVPGEGRRNSKVNLRLQQEG